MEPTGRKFDQDKPRWYLLPWEAVLEFVKVMTYGAKKYAPDNWQLVADAKERYFSAAMRHLYAWRHGEKIDPESGCFHLAHAGCCIMFLVWFDLKTKTEILCNPFHPEHEKMSQSSVRIPILSAKEAKKRQKKLFKLPKSSSDW